MSQNIFVSGSLAPRIGSSGRIVRTSLDEARSAIRPALWGGVFFSFLLTVLGFAGPLYMMNLYGRVLQSRNETTLVVLTLIVVFAMIVLSMIQTSKADLLRRASVMFDQRLSGELFDAIQKAIVRKPLDRSIPTLRDLDAMRDFIAGPALAGLMMLPFFPIFLVVCWIIHPAFVALVFVTSAAMALINWATSRSTAQPVREAQKAQQVASQRANTAFQNFETVQSMGMRPALRRGWIEMHEASLGWNVAADDRSMSLRVLGSFVRSLGNTTVLALAGFLVLNNQLDAAMIFAVSIIVGQATQPLQALVGSWKNITAARQAADRVQELLRETAVEPSKMAMPTPRGAIAVQDLALAPPGKGIEHILLRGINFEVPAGSVLAIIGPSASGKSSLARAIIGVWKPLRGTVRIDGTDIANWNDEELGPHLGYLSQNVDLFPGTVAENIARFSDCDPKLVIEAAERAGVHAMIQNLPNGYNTRVGEQGIGLSGGQRQRIGLARAIFGSPAIVVLDEPNSNLDAAGEEQLSEAIRILRERGTTVVFVTHKVSILNVADVIVVLGGGTMKDFGSSSDVMQRFAQPRLVHLRPPSALTPPSTPPSLAAPT
jgi:ATP-binding cassette, subfamily C, bacterial